jgi:hypothetical protein
MVAPDGTRVEPVVLDRGRGREQLYRVTHRYGHFRGHYTLEQLAQVVDLAELVDAGAQPSQ